MLNVVFAGSVIKSLKESMVEKEISLEEAIADYRMELLAAYYRTRAEIEHGTTIDDIIEGKDIEYLLWDLKAIDMHLDVVEYIEDGDDWSANLFNLEQELNQEMEFISMDCEEMKAGDDIC